jgi:hypothetical protein
MSKFKCPIVGCETEALCWVPRGEFGTILCYGHTMELVSRLSQVEMIMVYPIGWVLPMLGDLDLWEKCTPPEED